MNLLIGPSVADQGMRNRLLLLLGQSLTLGILVALVVIVGNTLFLSDFSTAFLPYVYFAVAILGTLVSYGTTKAQNIWTLPTVARTIMAAFILFFIAAWWMRTAVGAVWVSFALISTYPLVLRMSFVILGWQAGQLLDVRQIKQLFPHVVTGFVVGFIAGGMLMPFLLNLLNEIENVILVMALASLVVFILIIRVGQQFSDVFHMAPRQQQTRRQPTQSLLQLFRKPFVRWIFLYQLLMAVISKFTDYLLLAQTEIRYTTKADTAQFFSSFYSILNITDLVFLLVLAAFFLRRFGLKAGLLANPFFLAINFALLLIVGSIFGVSSTAFFVLIVISRIMIISLTDATTRTSVNAIYQAFPSQERTLVQTAAGGLAPQLALGVVGLVLLLFNAFPSLNFVHVALVTFLLVLLWSYNSLAVYRNYAKTLLQTIKRRALRDVELTLNDEVSVTAVTQLLQSEGVNEVHLALDMLETAEHPSFADHLLALLSRPQPDIQIEALHRLEQYKLTAALPRVQALLADEAETAVQGAALQTLCALAEAEAVPQVVPYLEREETAVKRGALVGLLRYGGITGIMAAAPYLEAAWQGLVAADRAMAAQVIGAVQRPDFYEPLLALLQDEDNSVQQAALAAAAQVQHPRLLPFVISNLRQAATRSAALSTLLAYGPAILPTVAAALSGESDHGVSDIKRLVRLCGQMGGAETMGMLWQHVHHPHSEIQEQIVVALSLGGFRAATADRPTIQHLLQQQAKYTATLLAAQRDIGTDEAVSALQRALQDEIERGQRRLFYLLSLLYDRQAILNTAKQFSQGEKREQALALEMLDITLSKEEKALVVPLIEPQLTLIQRLQHLPQRLMTPPKARQAWLADMIANETGVWQERWLQACAVHAAGKLGIGSGQAFQALIAEAARQPDSLMQETAAWALHAHPAV